MLLMFGVLQGAVLVRRREDAQANGLLAALTVVFLLVVSGIPAFGQGRDSLLSRPCAQR
jgi:hypothetical protein